VVLHSIRIAQERTAEDLQGLDGCQAVRKTKGDSPVGGIHSEGIGIMKAWGE
jgi:hypothetical protein